MHRLRFSAMAAAALVSFIVAGLLFTGKTTWKTIELPVAEMRSEAGAVVVQPRTVRADRLPAARVTMPAKDAKLTWFLHFHKAGGSSFAMLAGQNGVTKRARGGGGARGHSHLELNDEKFRWELIDSNDLPESCANEKGNRLAKRGAGKESKGSTSFQQELQNEMQGGVTFVSTEHWFPNLSEDKDADNVLRDNFNNNVRLVAVFREPIDRLVSSYYFHNCNGNRCPIGVGRYCNFTDWIRPETNMYTRMLNGMPFGPMKIGEQCTHALSSLPDRNNEHLLEKAKYVVREKFDLILTLDTLASRPEVAACALRRVLMWNRTKFPKVNKGHSTKGDTQCDRTRAPVDDSERAAATRANAMDVSLYKIAIETEAQILAHIGCA